MLTASWSQPRVLASRLNWLCDFKSTSGLLRLQNGTVCPKRGLKVPLQALVIFNLCAFIRLQEKSPYLLPRNPGNVKELPSPLPLARCGLLGLLPPLPQADPDSANSKSPRTPPPPPHPGSHKRVLELAGVSFSDPGERGLILCSCVCSSAGSITLPLNVGGAHVPQLGRLVLRSGWEPAQNPGIVTLMDRGRLLPPAEWACQRVHD